MVRFRQHIVFVLTAALMLSVSCRKDEAEVIPRSQMAEIYADMLVTDQWITTTPGIRLIADTSLVYEPILEQYGYDSDDYRKSIEFYMNDPERFARILRTSGEIIDKKIAKLKHDLAIEEARAKLPKIKSDFDPADFVPYLGDEPYVHYFDSLAVEIDTAMMYRLVSIERSDTLYDGLRMVFADSLAVNDSIPCRDSLELADSLGKKEKPDTLKFKIDTLNVISRPLLDAKLKKTIE